MKDQNFIYEQVKDIMDSGYICYHSIQKLLLSQSLYTDFKIAIYRTMTLFDVLYGGETWFLTLKEGHGLRDI
jgi:hypothetical protein